MVVAWAQCIKCIDISPEGHGAVLFYSGTTRDRLVFRVWLSEIGI